VCVCVCVCVSARACEARALFVCSGVVLVFHVHPADRVLEVDVIIMASPFGLLFVEDSGSSSPSCLKRPDSTAVATCQSPCSPALKASPSLWSFWL